jgi:regulator of replication initiation timing
MDSITSEDQSAADLGNIKEDFDSIKRLTDAAQVLTVPVKTKDGKCITTSEVWLQRWREFFKEILNSDCPPNEEEAEKEEATHSVPQTTDKCENTIEEGSHLCNEVNEEWESCRCG